MTQKKKKRPYYKSNFFFVVNELQDFIENTHTHTHTHTHTTGGQLPISKEPKTLI